MLLKQYQKIAMNQLLTESIKQMQKGGERSIVFKAPTGSGKTVIMMHYLKELSLMSLANEFAIIWISVNDLSDQSRVSFQKNLRESNLQFLQLDDIQDHELKANDILFINREKIRTVSKETGERKVLAMKANETGENLPTYLANTHRAGRKIILVVDESHRSLDTSKAQDLIRNYIKPSLQIEVSATPNSTDYDSKIEVNISDVINEGMIKKEVLINPGLAGYENSDMETDQAILSLALEKKHELTNLYRQNTSHVSPLLLIQLPSESKKTSELDTTKMQRIINLLEKQHNISFSNQKLAIWLSEDKTNRDLIDLHNSSIEVLIFKQAIATGRDCPRAQILVMFREIKTVTFEIQTVGRILRMPEHRHYDDELLNKAYVYTDLPKAAIGIHQTAKDIISNNTVARDSFLCPSFSLPMKVRGRVDYKDIGYSFYAVLAETLVNHIGGAMDVFTRHGNYKLFEKYVDISDKTLEQELLSDGVMIIDIDQHSGETITAQSNAHFTQQEELIKLSFDNFAKYQVGPEFTNIARSYKPIIEALYYALDNYVFTSHYRESKANTRLRYQTIILRQPSFFIDVLRKAKAIYLPIRKNEIAQRQSAYHNQNTTRTVPSIQSVTDKAILQSYRKHVMQPCILSLDSQQEKEFIARFLEVSPLVRSRYKNGTGSDHFSIPYIDKDGEQRLFFPDFFVFFTDGSIGIFDPKGGFTLEDSMPKAQALHDYIKIHNQTYSLIGGLIEVHPDHFLIAVDGNYTMDDRSGFEVFDDKWIVDHT